MQRLLHSLTTLLSEEVARVSPNGMPCSVCTAGPEERTTVMMGATHLVDVLGRVCSHSLLETAVSMTPVHCCSHIPASRPKHDVPTQLGSQAALPWPATGEHARRTQLQLARLWKNRGSSKNCRAVPWDRDMQGSGLSIYVAWSTQ